MAKIPCEKLTSLTSCSSFEEERKRHRAEQDRKDRELAKMLKDIQFQSAKTTHSIKVIWEFNVHVLTLSQNGFSSKLGLIPILK